MIIPEGNLAERRPCHERSVGILHDIVQKNWNGNISCILNDLEKNFKYLSNSFVVAPDPLCSARFERRAQNVEKL
jgi:hypothetical protein